MNAAERIFQDLLNLEIDVIVKPGMTARKMPEPWYALMDIVGDYDMFLNARAAALDAAWRDPQADPVRVRPAELDHPSPNRQTVDGELRKHLDFDTIDEPLSIDTLDKLRERAVEAEAVYKHAIEHWRFPQSDTGMVLKRIYRNCDQLKGILVRPDVTAVLQQRPQRSDPKLLAKPLTGDDVTLPLKSDELVTIRKVWEVGTETVVMQTVVQLDGDVVTRIQAGRESAADEPIHELQRQSVTNALQNWQFLGQTVATFMTSALKSFFLG